MTELEKFKKEVIIEKVRFLIEKNADAHVDGLYERPYIYDNKRTKAHKKKYILSPYKVKYRLFKPVRKVTDTWCTHKLSLNDFRHIMSPIDKDDIIETLYYILNESLK